MHLPARRGAQDRSGGRDERGQGQADRDRPRRLQQHCRQHGAGKPRRERGRGCHCLHPAHLLPPAGVRHCQVLERYVRCRPEHRVRHLQHPAAGRHGADHEPAERDAEEPQRGSREEQLHAHAGHPDVQGCRYRRPRLFINSFLNGAILFSSITITKFSFAREHPT